MFTVYVIKLHVWLNVFSAKSKEYLIAILTSRYILCLFAETHIKYNIKENVKISRSCKDVPISSKKP